MRYWFECVMKVIWLVITASNLKASSFKVNTLNRLFAVSLFFLCACLIGYCVCSGGPVATAGSSRALRIGGCSASAGTAFPGKHRRSTEMWERWIHLQVRFLLSLTYSIPGLHRSTPDLSRFGESFYEMDNSYEFVLGMHRCVNVGRKPIIFR